MHQFFNGRTAAALLAMLLLAYGATAHAAADSTADLHWRCAQGGDDEYSVVCIPVPIRADALEDDLELTPRPAAVATTRGRDLRPVAKRGFEEIFAEDAWYVPLYGPPTEPDRVRELLRAVLCGRQAGCTIEYGAQTDSWQATQTLLPSLSRK